MQLSAIYTASLNSSAKIITAVVIVVSVGGILLCIRSLRKSKGDKLALFLNVFIIASLVATVVLSYLYSPKNYVMGNFDLTINRPIGGINIPVKDILEVRHLSESETKDVVRTFGVGGLFGYFGHYSGTILGDMQWYVTNPKNMVIIRTNQGDAYVISPDDKDFISWLDAKRNDL